MKIKMLLLVFVLSIFIFGCAQKEAAKTSVQSGAQPVQKASSQETAESFVTVNIYDGGFKPEEVTIPVGGTVKWVNLGSKDHTVSGPNFPMTASTSPKTSGRLQQGESWQKTFDREGYFSYTDMYDDNLKGKVVVK